jgi:hypothetical protein
MYDDARLLNQSKQFEQDKTNYEFFIRVVLVYANRIWLIQTLISILYCFHIRRLKPVKRKDLKDESIFVLQFLVMLISNLIIYVIELSMIKNWTEKLDTCLHHAFSICIFIQTFIENNIVSLIYLLPYFTHTIYWSSIINYDDVLLAIYYISFLITCIFLINRSVLQEISYKIPLYGMFISTVNLSWYFHGQDLNLFNFQTPKLMLAIIKAMMVNMPVYINFHYILAKKETDSII